jgi:CRP-like cAMP-binding protein
MSPPEEIKCSEGETSKDLFFIAKGECECYIRDLDKKERFVRVLFSGQHFGEISFLTGAKRTATI